MTLDELELGDLTFGQSVWTKRLSSRVDGSRVLSDAVGEGRDKACASSFQPWVKIGVNILADLVSRDLDLWALPEGSFLTSANQVSHPTTASSLSTARCGQQRADIADEWLIGAPAAMSLNPGKFQQWLVQNGKRFRNAQSNLSAGRTRG